MSKLQGLKVPIHMGTWIIFPCPGGPYLFSLLSLVASLGGREITYWCVFR